MYTFKAKKGKNACEQIMRLIVNQVTGEITLNIIIKSKDKYNQQIIHLSACSCGWSDETGKEWLTAISLYLGMIEYSGWRMTRATG